MKAGHQFSLVDGVKSGTGALHEGTAAVDQTGNLLGILATVHTPNVKVGTSVTNFAGKRMRFGGVGAQSGHAFDYPDLAIKNPQGNGQSYKASVGGYLPGNNNAGQAGYGHTRQFDQSTMVSGDLTDAYRRADIMSDMYAPEHVRTVNRDYETLREHFEEQAKEHEKEKIAHLMAMGFSEEEIARKAAKDREKAIEQASKMEAQPSSSLEKALMRAAPTTDIGISVAPGLMPNRMNADSYQRAVGAGTMVTKGKAAEAMRRREKMALKIDAEKPEVKAPMKHTEIVQMMMGIATKEEHKRQEQSMRHEEKVIAHQKMREDARMARHFAMQKAMEKK
jgi:hypothetical protein